MTPLGPYHTSQAEQNQAQIKTYIYATICSNV